MRTTMNLMGSLAEALLWESSAPVSITRAANTASPMALPHQASLLLSCCAPAKICALQLSSFDKLGIPALAGGSARWLTLPGAHALSLVKILGMPLYRGHPPLIVMTVDSPVHLLPKIKQSYSVESSLSRAQVYERLWVYSLPSILLIKTSTCCVYHVIDARKTLRDQYSLQCLAVAVNVLVETLFIHHCVKLYLPGNILYTEQRSFSPG